MYHWLRAYQIREADIDDLIREVITVVSQELGGLDHNLRTGAFRNWSRKIIVYRLQNFWQRKKQRPLAKGRRSVLDGLEQMRDDASELFELAKLSDDRDSAMRRLLGANASSLSGDHE